MKKILKTNIGLMVLTVLALSAGRVSGQSRNEVSVFTGGVVTHLSHDLRGTEQQNKNFRPSVGIGYSFYISEQWALNLEGHYQNYESGARFGTIDGSYATVDNEGERFEFRYSINGFSESQQVNVLHIPLTLQFETKGETRFFARAGGQIGLLIASEYQSTVGSLNTSGYYEQYDAELFDPAFMGFGQFDNVRQRATDLGWEKSVEAVFEAGIKYPVGTSGNLYLSLILNYGLNTLSAEAAPTNLLQYQTETPSTFTLNSVFDSGYAEDARLRSFGVKLRYGFNGF